MYSWIIPLGGIGNLDLVISLAITRLRDKYTMRDDNGQLIAESWDGEFKTLEIVTEIDKIERLAGLDLSDDSELLQPAEETDLGWTKMQIAVPTVESRDRRRRRVHRALTRFAEEERGVLAKGSGVWEVDASCKEMENLLNYLEDLLKEDRHGERYGPEERFIDLVFDQPERVLEDVPSLLAYAHEKMESTASVDLTESPSLRIGLADSMREHQVDESLSEEIREIMVEICGSGGSAHITEIHDKVSLIDDFSDDDVDGAIALLLSSDSITKIGEDEYEIKKDIDRRAATKDIAAYGESLSRIAESSATLGKKTVELKRPLPTRSQRLRSTILRTMRDRTYAEKSPLQLHRHWLGYGHDIQDADASEFFEMLAKREKIMSEMQIGNQLQSVFEMEVKKGHWPMKSMKQKGKGEVPTVKWKIHELVMEILWSNYQAESDEATLESGESEDFQYKAPGYLPTSQITSGLKSKYGVEKSDGRISQVLGDLCGLGVFKSEKVKGSRGKMYKLTTKGKVMMKGNRFSITPSGDIVATT